MGTAKISGRITYLTREAMPDVTLTVTLYKPSSFGGHAKIVASTTRFVPSFGTLAYMLEYDPATVDLSTEYAITAQIYRNDNLNKVGTVRHQFDSFEPVSLNIPVNVGSTSPITEPTHSVHALAPIDVSKGGFQGTNHIDKA